MKSNNNHRGIVLITTLLIVGFLLMFAGGIILTTQRQATMTNQFLHREKAVFASQTGINYALMRLNNDPYWMGCQRNSSGLTGTDYSFAMGSGQKVSIKEHQVSGNQGAVEGKIDGGSGGYFEIYFVKPDEAKEKMEFFGSGTGKMPLPTKIPLSSNRNNQLTTPPTNPGDDPSSWTKYSDDTYYKPVPENSILLVCRGTMGNEHKTLELCVRMGPGEDYNSVAIGRGDISININPSGSLYLDTVVADKPPIIRTKGSINVSNGLAASTDYLTVNGSGGGRASGSIGFTPAPTNNANTFQSGVPVQDNMYPPLQLSSVVPNGTTFGKLNAGYYKLDTTGSNLKVTYYQADNKTDAESGSAKTITDGSDSLSALITNGTITWDSKHNILVINKSVEVNAYSALSSLNIVGPDDTAIGVQLNSVVDPAKGKVNNVYLVNNNVNGNINVEGSLTGIGTVVVKGNLDMQGESQLSAVEDSGISIYAQGDISINALEAEPKNIKGIEDLTAQEIGMLEEAKIAIQDITNQINANKPNKLESYEITKIDATNSTNGLWGTLTVDQWNLLAKVGAVYAKNSVFGSNECIKLSANDIDKIISKGVKSTGETFTNKEGKIIDPKDCKFTGLVFTCNDFKVNIPENRFALIGGLVAYGGDPGSGSGSNNKGNITINAYSADFTYDTKYLSMLQGLTSSKIETLYWGSY